MAFRVLIVDHHKIVREGLKAILERSHEFSVIGDAENGQRTMEICRKTQPDLVIMDVELGGLTGVEVTKDILKQFPEIKVVILSVHGDDETVLAAMRAGARAFLVKKASSDDLLDALTTVARGGTYIGAQVSDRLLARIQSGDLKTKMPAILEGVTPREMQVFRLVTEGNSSKEVAELLSLGVETVRSYRKNLMRKLGVKNVAGLFNIAIAAKLTGGKASGGSAMMESVGSSEQKSD